MAAPFPDPFVDLLRLWRVDPIGHADPVIEAAAQLAADGVGGPVVAALASEGPEASRSGLGRLVNAVIDESDLGSLEGAALQDDAVAAMTRRYLEGLITPRELTYWVTRVVGLRGGERSQVFINFETEYCQRLADTDVSDIDARVDDEARALSSGEPAPSLEAPARGIRALFKRKAR